MSEQGGERLGLCVRVCVCACVRACGCVYVYVYDTGSDLEMNFQVYDL